MIAGPPLVHLGPPGPDRTRGLIFLNIPLDSNFFLIERVATRQRERTVDVAYPLPSQNFPTFF